MKKYVCKICGYIEENDIDDNYKCHMCGSSFDNFNELDDAYIKNELSDVIDSVVDDVFNQKKSRINNNQQEDKRVQISEYNNCIDRIPEKCINCGQCKKTCEEIVNISYDLAKCNDPICIGCGQCILNCPTGAMIPKYEYKEVKNIIGLDEKIVVALISPAVRVSIGESFGLKSGENNEKKLVTALRKLGFDYVFDTAFGADLTVLEEVSEFASRLKNKKNLPQFTSCCPAWVKYAEVYHPELIGNLSNCKSPIGMQCAIIKSYFCEKKRLDPNKIVTVAITPCTSKKMEAKEYTLNIDYVLTASELTLYLREENIDFEVLGDSDYDQLMGESSGGGVIFGSTGGVCESVIRTLHMIITKNNLNNDDFNFSDLRGFDGIKEANVSIGDFNIKVAVVQQMKNLEKLLENDFYKKFHFIEVMNCKGGCVGGGGQPLCQIPKMDDIKKQRADGLYNIDKKRAIRCAHDNKELKTLYKDYLEKPLSERSIKLLHTSFSDKSSLLNDKIKK